MHTPRQKLKKPLKIQKKLIVRGSFLFLFLLSAVVFYYFAATHQYELKEFIAEKIDAKLETVLVSGVENISSETLLSKFPLKKGDSLVGFKAISAGRP